MSEAKEKPTARIIKCTVLGEDMKGESYENKPHISAFAGDMNFMVPYILGGGPPSQRNADGTTILHAAVDGWQYRMVEFLVLSGAKVNAQNKHGDTPLHAIVRSRDIPFEGQFLRHIAPEDARKETFRMLLRHHADPSILNMQGANALHLAAYEGDQVAIVELLPGGRMLSIDAVTSKGATALLLAILQEHVACVKRLIAFGADVNFQYKNDITPLRLLYSSENPELRALCNTQNTKRIEPEN